MSFAKTLRKRCWQWRFVITTTVPRKILRVLSFGTGASGIMMQASQIKHAEYYQEDDTDIALFRYLAKGILASQLSILARVFRTIAAMAK